MRFSESRAKLVWAMPGVSIFDRRSNIGHRVTEARCDLGPSPWREEWIYKAPKHRCDVSADISGGLVGMSYYLLLSIQFSIWMSLMFLKSSTFSVTMIILLATAVAMA